METQGERLDKTQISLNATEGFLLSNNVVVFSSIWLVLCVIPSIDLAMCS